MDTTTTQRKADEIQRVSAILECIHDRQSKKGASGFVALLVVNALDIMKQRPDITPLCAVLSAYHDPVFNYIANTPSALRTPE